jgi:hypothetical protein
MENRCEAVEADAFEDSCREKRRSPRLNIYLPAGVCGMGEDNELVQESTITVNISEEGAYLLGVRPHRPGSTLALWITLPRYRGEDRGIGPVFYCEALVVRVELFRGHAVSCDNGKFGFAVEFRNGARFPLPEAALMGAPRMGGARGTGIEGQPKAGDAYADIGADGARLRTGSQRR